MTSGQFLVDGTAVQLASSNACYRHVIIHVVGNTGIYIGDSTVTTSNGLYLDKGAGPLTVFATPTDAIYAVSASGTTTVTVLTTNA